jgi:hypothetical protein
MPTEGGLRRPTDIFGDLILERRDFTDRQSDIYGLGMRKCRDVPVYWRSRRSLREV